MSKPVLTVVDDERDMAEFVADAALREQVVRER